MGDICVSSNLTDQDFQGQWEEFSANLNLGNGLKIDVDLELGDKGKINKKIDLDIDLKSLNEEKEEGFVKICILDEEVRMHAERDSHPPID